MNTEQILKAATPQVAVCAIPGFKGYYADTNGGIWSMSQWRGYPWRQLAAHPDSDGYLQVRLQVGARRISKKVHALVALTFLLKPEGCDQLRHLDSDKTHNQLANLVWGTAIDNAADRDAIGHCRGAENGRRSGHKLIGRKHTPEAKQKMRKPHARRAQ